MSIANTNKAFAQRAVIALNGVKIYSLPMVEDPPIATLTKDDTVRVIGQRGGWVKIGFANDKKGWMQLQVNRNRGHGGEVDGLPNQAGENGGTNGKNPDRFDKPSRTGKRFNDTLYRRFGYSFGMGLVELDYTYTWKFMFHSKPRLALEGSFKHVLGKAADSYFIMANLSYLLKERERLLPYITGGLGVINTVPDRSISSNTVSHMAINYGVGARKLINERLSVVFTATQYTAFGKGISQFHEITVGLLVGNFWD
ncbi:SH3 domain-containing protein [candidate division KSB1 bacterium]|nr:SH3 domain-containing protein [candidate division KSB1 bacterium]NIR73311.1 SH3 domain-containing protein [candidate division KSB1 bacterium]NIS27017.1 SH3 domain-containing protein [candidate division KSB1 bacterium]NIT73857.1 SH3 domain-containing protein [candidate division KSB1 bacterium]NIU27762.1 SH3 domain-containing protein [candidate division KSB1 bacterium]